MSGTDSRLDRIERRIEANIQACHQQTEAIAALSVIIQDIHAKLSKPAGSELSDAIREQAALTAEIHTMVAELHEAAFHQNQ